MGAWRVFDDPQIWSDASEVKNKASGQSSPKAPNYPALPDICSTISVNKNYNSFYF